MSWIASPSHLLLTARSWQLQLPTQLQIVAWTFVIVTKIVILILYCVVENVHQMENYICVICVAYHHLLICIVACVSNFLANFAWVPVGTVSLLLSKEKWCSGLSGSPHTHARPASNRIRQFEIPQTLKPWLSLLVDNGGSSNKAVARNWCFSVWGRCKGSN